MDTSNVCPTEDAIQAFLDYLVEPMLPSKYSLWETPTLDKQQAVAKQVRAVVLLYNYYHRKRHLHLEYLGFEPFCKLALVAKPNLKSYMNLMLRSDDTELSDLGKQISLTEKAIKDACDISTSLDASREVPSTKGWPVSKVAIFLIDLRKENCALQNGSIAEGVWSVIEKDVPVFCCSSDGSTEAKHMNKNPTEKKHMNKRKRTPNKPLQDELGADESCFQQVAFSAVKEATNNGISQSDLTIIESHIVYSLSKEKTATRFYIMQCVHAEKDCSLWIPIKDVINSLQGPLVKKNSSHWMHSSAVEYFHLLPFVRIISQWFLSSQDQESVLEVVNEYGPEMTEKPCEPEAVNNRNRNMISGGVVEALSNSTNAESENQNEKNELCTDGILDAIDGPWNMDVNDNFVVYSEQTLTCKNLAEKVQHDAQLKMNSFAESDSDGATNVAKFEVVDSIFQSICHSRKAACKYMPSCQDGMPTGNHAPVIHESNSEYSAKLQNIVASKEHILSETAWRVLHRKRDKLVRQLRNIGDEIAQCDKQIQTILSGGEDDLELKIDLIIEGCNDVCLRSASQGRTSHDYEDQCSTHYIKRNRLSEEALSTQNPCQELDGICNKNNWMLPTYHVFPSDGGYQAKVTVKGVNIESSSVGDACPKPSEARGSAAAEMLAKLNSMLTPAP
ncbi:PREDICTED: uncharacterized protein LOC18602556 isoform X1 [Theobroma cacao]|uniref:Uncharacterized protein LOC18602556 isoform X1 n=1 Tax=Theobroma cacao TaxID=3641 RepID=A0AB32WCC0_THECC|nr:PREDICTED: uncharacterized protein LOC18602556 isoform X1 [Theobroma cacao]XP_017975639.1 PREDICTED: uncharacterized protein LOC18602556 isoform X1 [Theobroma cacao]